MPLSEDAIRYEILQRMPNFNKSVKHSILATKVASYLQDQKRVLAQLKQLEVEMKQEVNTRLGVLPNTPIDLKDTQFQFGQKIKHMRNLLTAVLLRLEAAN